MSSYAPSICIRRNFTWRATRPGSAPGIIAFMDGGALKTSIELKDIGAHIRYLNLMGNGLTLFGRSEDGNPLLRSRPSTGPLDARARHVGNGDCRQGAGVRRIRQEGFAPQGSPSTANSNAKAAPVARVPIPWEQDRCVVVNRFSSVQTKAA